MLRVTTEGIVSVLARPKSPVQLALGPGGVVLVADRGSRSVLRIAPSGRTETVTRGLKGTRGVAVLPGGAVVVTGSRGVFRVTGKGTRRPLAVSAADGTLVRLRDLGQLTASASGTLLLTQRSRDRVGAVAPDGRLTTVAGSGRTRTQARQSVRAIKPPPEVDGDHNAECTPGKTKRYQHLYLVPSGTKALKDRRGGPTVRLAYYTSASPDADVTVELLLRGRRVGLTTRRHVPWSRDAARVDVRPSRGGAGTTYAVRLWGVSNNEFHAVACDFRNVRAR